MNRHTIHHFPENDFAAAAHLDFGLRGEGVINLESQAVERYVDHAHIDRLDEQRIERLQRSRLIHNFATFPSSLTWRRL